MTIRWNGYDKGLDPTFKAHVEQALGPLSYVYQAVQGKRDPAYQHSLFLKGRDPDTLQVVDRTKVVTNADAGKSAHEYGLAADFAVVDHGKVVWEASHPGYAAKRRAIDAIATLKDGYYIVLPSGRDVGHVERRDWKLYKAPLTPADVTRTSGLYSVITPSPDPYNEYGTDATADTSWYDDILPWPEDQDPRSQGAIVAALAMLGLLGIYLLRRGGW